MKMARFLKGTSGLFLFKLGNNAGTALLIRIEYH